MIKDPSSNINLLVTLFLNRAACNLHLHNYGVVEEDCRLAYSLQSNSFGVFLCKSIVSLLRNKYAEAVTFLNKAMVLKPSNECLNDYLSMLTQLIKNEAEMKIKFNYIFELDSDLYDLMVNLNDDVEVKSTEWQKQQIENISRFLFQKKDSLQPPPLVPIGDPISENCNSNLYLEEPSTKNEDLALNEKQKGNNAFKQNNFLTALEHYSKSIRLNCRDPVFYSNRALVYLKLNRLYESITDCTTSIELKPSIKAYARRAAAWSSIGVYRLATEDYKEALKFEPKNTDCRLELQNCLQKWQIELKKKMKEDPNNESLKSQYSRIQKKNRRGKQRRWTKLKK